MHALPIIVHTPGDNTVNVGMIHEIMAPGVQNADSPYPCAKMFLVIGEFHKRLRNGAEEKIVHDFRFIDTRRFSSEGMVKTT